MRPTRSLALLALVATSAAAHAEEPDDRGQPLAVEAVPAVDRTPDGKREPTGRFEIGAGLSSDEGFVAHAAVAQDDLFHTGQQLSLSADISALRQRFVITHDIPTLFGTGLALRTELFSARRSYPGFTREGTGGAVTLAHQLDRSTRIYARYRLEHVSMDLGAPELNGMAARLLDGNLGDGTIATVTGGIVHDTLDQHALPLHGTYLHLFAERADRQLGSEYDFDRFGAVADHARSLGPFTLRLHGHATYVRTLGSQGSNLAAIGRVELELPVWRRAGLSIAGFVDAGVRSNEDASWGPIASSLQRSVGLSIIWRSPLGPLRFDVAFPLDGKDRDRQFLLNFGVPF
ncbi:MAG: outer membrane protein assembly complex, YaeT protein [Deltaproteobacteria bacterium]|nr:outer membrane protein assembly complex, YaeT protein [Deltaproteobacteria bacterium]